MDLFKLNRDPPAGEPLRLDYYLENKSSFTFSYRAQGLDFSITFKAVQLT